MCDGVYWGMGHARNVLNRCMRITTKYAGVINEKPAKAHMRREIHPENILKSTYTRSSALYRPSILPSAAVSEESINQGSL